MVSASSLLRASRRASGLSQRALARVARVAQPRIATVESGAFDTSVARLERLVAATGGRVTVLPTRARPVWEASLAIGRAIDEGDEATAFREVIQVSDDLACAEGAVRVALAVAPAVPCGDARYDALLAGVVDYWLVADRLPRPEWLAQPAWTLAEPWDVEPVPGLRAAARRATPRPIARHGVFLAASELASL